jgi:multiple sugar transport system permease protein
MSATTTPTTPPVVVQRDPNVVRNERLKDAATYLLLILACTLTTGPIVFLVATSLKETYTRTVDLSVFLDPTFVNYSKIWNEHPFQDWMRNSLLVATAVTIGILILDSLAGYAFARKKFRGKDTVFFLILATLMVPLPVTLLPIFLLANDLDWIDTYRALIFPALAYPVGVFMMRQFIQTIPGELEDAARIDGMSDFGIYVRVILPLCIPGLAVLGLYTFTTSWGAFLWPLIVATSDATRTIPPGLATIPGQYNTDWGLATAATVASMIPMLFIFLIFQRYLRQGFSGGRSTKG